MANDLSSLTLPLPRRRLDGCACHSPLAHFHIHHTESSIREIHPFTTITHLASAKLAIPSPTSAKVISLSKANDESITIQFLFRKSESKTAGTTSSHHPREAKKSKQWTNKLASLVDEASIDVPRTSDPEKSPDPRLSSSIQTSLRLEGPYFTPANPASYNTVICLVAGTGISGAIAIAAAFSAQSSPDTPELALPTEPLQAKKMDTPDERQLSPPSRNKWRRCIVLWSIRESDYIAMPFFHETPGLEVRPHLTGGGRQRLDPKEAIDEIHAAEPGGSMWVYVSGPNSFVQAGEKACRGVGVDFFGARWG